MAGFDGITTLVPNTAIPAGGGVPSLQTWTPTITGSGSMTIASVSGDAYYLDYGTWVHFFAFKRFTVGGSISSAVYLTTPWNNSLNVIYRSGGSGATSSGGYRPIAMWANGVNQLALYRFDGSAWTLGVTDIYVVGVALK